jgi:hypothetical protein
MGPIKYYLGDGRHAEGIHIANGQMLNTKHINKFGYNAGVPSSWELIAVNSNNITYPTTADVVSLVSTHADDDGTDLANEGAFTVEIQGLDANYNEQSATVTMTGQVAVTTTETFLRVFRMSVESSYDDDGATGIITASIDGNVQATISPTYDNQTLQCSYTIPAGKTGYLIRMQATATKSNKTGMVGFFIREFDDIDGSATTCWKVKQLIETFRNSTTIDFPVPIVIPEKADCELRAKNIEDNSLISIGGTYDLLIVTNPE